MPKKKSALRKKPTSSGVQVSVSGNVSGQVAGGKNIQQVQGVTRGQVNIGDGNRQAIGADNLELTARERKELQRLLNELRDKVASSVPSEQKDAALERVQELEQAVAEKKPDLTTMEYVKNWFARNLPSLAGAVTGLILNPLIGKLVEAGGDLLVKDFQRRFGETQ